MTIDKELTATTFETAICVEDNGGAYRLPEALTEEWSEVFRLASRVEWRSELKGWGEWTDSVIATIDDFNYTYFCK